MSAAEVCILTSSMYADRMPCGRCPRFICSDVRSDPQAVELTTGGLTLHEPDKLLDGVWSFRIPVEDHVLGRG